MSQSESRQRIETALAALPADVPDSRPVALASIDILDVFLTGDDDKPHFEDEAHAACAYLTKAAAKSGSPELCPPVGMVKQALQQLGTVAAKTKSGGTPTTGDAKP